MLIRIISNLLTLMVVITSSAQESKWIVGGGVTYCSYIKNPGINLNVTYRLIGNFHIGPDFSALLTKENDTPINSILRKELEYNFNGHYLIDINRALACYPLVGVNVSKVTIHPKDATPDKRFITAMNLGGGIEWKTASFRIFFESKYVSKLSKYDLTTGILFEL